MGMGASLHATPGIHTAGVQTEKELQSGGEVKELMQQVDDLSKK